MSEIRAATVSNLAGTGPVTLTKQSAAKAWANLNGSGTIAFIASFNASSAVDNGTGDYDINFTNAMSSANYLRSGGAFSFSSTNIFASGPKQEAANHTASKVGLISVFQGTGSFDRTGVTVIVNGDLA
jgi:hypothetical protein